VQDIRQPTPLELQLGIRNQGRNYLLLLSADAQFARAHLTLERRSNAPTPPNFCMSLRKRIENAYILAVRQRGFDRILEIEILARNEAGENEVYLLIAELMGKHSNLILVTAENQIVDAAKRITHRVNRLRETLPGRPYLAPPEQTDRLDPFAPETPERLQAEALLKKNTTEGAGSETDAEALSHALMQTCSGLSPFLARELALRLERKSLLTLWREVFGAAAEGAFEPVELFDAEGVLVGAYPFPSLQFPPDRQAEVSNLNLALDKVYRETLTKTSHAHATTELRGRIEKEIKRLETHLHSVERALAEAERAEEHKQTGELILANIWQIQPGMASITALDYYQPDTPERAIELDPRKSPQENAELWFRRYRKAKDGAEIAETQRKDALRSLARLEEAKAQLAELTEEAAVRNLKTHLIAVELLRGETGATQAEASSRHAPDFQGHKIKRVTTPEGYEIYIGETATANDFLTTRLAAPNDLWIHVRAAASSHVVIRTHGKPEEVPRSVIEYAATLCARHSSQKHSNLVAVDFTLKKFVRKPRGSAPGGADYERETTLHVSPNI
jgi:predicted ribosome quality control (RQC) complex YloA/Tae2 family protein